jgi:hypothetical protein
MPPFIPNKFMYEKYAKECDEGDSDETKRWKAFSYACREMMKDKMKVAYCDQPIRDKMAYTAFMQGKTNEVKLEGGEEVFRAEEVFPSLFKKKEKTPLKKETNEFEAEIFDEESKPIN